MADFSDVFHPGFRATVDVTYRTLTKSTLEDRFGRHIDVRYDSTLVFEPIEACRLVDRTPRPVTFEYVRCHGVVDHDAVLAEISRRERRPVLPEEAFDFVEKHPREQLKFPIPVLGATTRLQGSLFVQCYYQDSYGVPTLVLKRIERGHGYDDRFLVACE